MFDKSAFDLENCSPIFLSCCSLANQLSACLLLLGTGSIGHPQLCDAAQPLSMGLPNLQQRGAVQEELCQVASTFIFADKQCLHIYFHQHLCIRGIFAFLTVLLCHFAASVMAALWIFPFPILWSSEFVRAEHFWRKLSEEDKRHSNMSKNRLGLLMYLVPCFQTAACWEPRPSVFSFFFLQEYVLSTIWFIYKVWNNRCWRENLMLFRSS